MSFVMAIAIATPFALLLGGGYGWLLNKIKGGEMMVATLRRLLLRLLHVHDVAAAAVQARDGVGLLRLRPSYHHLLEGFYDRVLADISPSTSTASASTSSFRPAV